MSDLCSNPPLVLHPPEDSILVVSSPFIRLILGDSSDDCKTSWESLTTSIKLCAQKYLLGFPPHLRRFCWPQIAATAPSRNHDRRSEFSLELHTRLTQPPPYREALSELYSSRISPFGEFARIWHFPPSVMPFSHATSQQPRYWLYYQAGLHSFCARVHLLHGAFLLR